MKYLKKLLTTLLSVVGMLLAFIMPVFAEAQMTLKTAFENAFVTYGGYAIILYILFRVAIWIIRKSENKVDDKILDTYVSKAVDFALTIIPANSTVNWIKFVGNALGQFQTAYIKEQGEIPSESVMEKAKTLIYEVADKVEFKNIKDALQDWKAGKLAA